MGVCGVDNIIKIAHDRFEQAKSYYQEEYDRGESDVRFVFGDQWDEKIKRQRAGRVCLVENRCLPFVHQVVNSVRQANPSIKVHPVDEKSDVDTADILKGIIKNIEVCSKASNAYDSAVWNAASFGRGWLRVNTKYIDGTFDQEINIDRITNPKSVYIDPNSQCQDASDAEWGFVFLDIDKVDFKKQYPKASIEPFTDSGKSWYSDDNVRVAEYFVKQYKDVEISLTNEGVFDSKDVPAGVEVIETRTDKRCTVKWYKITGDEILDETEWLGYCIPLIPVIGEEVFIDGKRQCFSLINQARNPQQMLNYWKTAGVEVVALQPKTPFIGAVGQFESMANEWASANNSNNAVLMYDLVKDEATGQVVPPPQRQPVPTGSMAILQEGQLAADGIKASLGMFDASMGMSGTEISGSAINARKVQGDNSTFHFVDNLAIALRQLGTILVDLIPKIYTGARIARIIGEDGLPKMAPINQPYAKNDNGDLVPAINGVEQQGRYQLDLGKYDVVVDVGSSYSTRREEAVNSMLEVANIDPRIMEIAPDLFFSNLDIPNGQELAKRMKSIIDPKFLTDDPIATQLQQTQEALQQVQSDMEAQVNDLLVKLNTKQDNSEIELNQKQQEIELKKSDLEIKLMKTSAEIRKLEAEANNGIPAEAANDFAEAITQIKDGLNDVSGAVEHIIAARELECCGDDVKEPHENNEVEDFKEGGNAETIEKENEDE